MSCEEKRNVRNLEKLLCKLPKDINLIPILLSLIRPDILLPNGFNVPGELVDLIIFRIINLTLRSFIQSSAWGLTVPGASFILNGTGYDLTFSVKEFNNAYIGEVFHQGKMILWKGIGFTGVASLPSLPFYLGLYPNGVVDAVIEFVNSSTDIRIRNVPFTQVQSYVPEFVFPSRDGDITFQLRRDAELSVFM